MSQNFTDNTTSTELVVNVTTTPLAGTVEEWTVASASGLPLPPFEFGIDLISSPELGLCTAIHSITPTTTIWTVQRGFDGSTPTTHSASAGQIICVTSAITPREGNAHITEHYTDSSLSVPDPIHPQYLDSAGSRHNVMTFPDGTLTHPVSSSIATNNLTPPPQSHWGDVPYTGHSPNAANVDHVHGRESGGELENGLWPAGTIVLYAGQGVPTGWMECQGQDVRIDLAPELYAQIGFVFGSAIDWYPAITTLPSQVAYDTQNVIDPYNGATVRVDAPYTYMPDPRKLVMYLPPGSNEYLKLPNIGQIEGIPASIKWIIKVDAGYVWEPRPSSPPAAALSCAPYAIDTSYPQAFVVDTGAFSLIQVKTPLSAPGSYSTGFSWGFDVSMGIPAILGSGFISPGEFITGPFLIPVLPYGAPIPDGMMLLPTAPPTPVQLETTILGVTAAPIVTTPPPTIPTATTTEPNVQLKYVQMSVTNGFGYILLTDTWTNLAGAPFINASDPAVDGYYITGSITAQQRNGQIMLVVSDVNQVVVNSAGTPGSPAPMTTSTLSVFYPAFA